jgi:hypothetical protein
VIPSANPACRIHWIFFDVRSRKVAASHARGVVICPAPIGGGYAARRTTQRRSNIAHPFGTETAEQGEPMNEHLDDRRRCVAAGGLGPWLLLVRLMVPGNLEPRWFPPVPAGSRKCHRAFFGTPRAWPAVDSEGALTHPLGPRSQPLATGWRHHPCPHRSPRTPDSAPDKSAPTTLPESGSTFRPPTCRVSFQRLGCAGLYL